MQIYFNDYDVYTDTADLSRNMTKPTKWHVRPAKTQISLGIRPVWSESSLSAWRKLGSLATNWAHSEDSDQTGRMPRLIWVFAGRTCHFVGFVMMRLILFLLPNNGNSMRINGPKNSTIKTMYRKTPKNSDTRNNYCSYHKIWPIWIFHTVMWPNNADKMANSPWSH